MKIINLCYKTNTCIVQVSILAIPIASGHAHMCVAADFHFAECGGIPTGRIVPTK